MKTKNKIIFAVVCSLLVGSTGCQLEQLFPGRVADGVARMTVRNIGNVVSLITEDATCGFASPAAVASRQTAGQLGEEGSVTESIAGCVLNFPNEIVLSSDCNGVETRARGKVTVTGTRTLSGVLTGSDETPALPMSPEPMVMELSLTFDNFWVGSAGTSFEQKSGTVSFTVKPHVAVSQSLGVCAAPTRDLTFENIVCANIEGRVVADGSEFDVSVPACSLNAQLGQWQEQENTLQGSVTVWDSRESVPTDDLGLDPEYDRETFLASYACAVASPDLALPVDYDCPSLAPRLAEGAAPLSLQAFGQLIDELDLDENCGFSAPSVMNNPEVEGTLGERGGEATWTVAEPCTLTWHEPTVIDEDCNGLKTYAVGSFSAYGTKSLRGYVTGDPLQPIVPDSWTPAEVVAHISFDELTIWTSDVDRKFTVRSGEITGKIEPRTEMDDSLKVCALKIPTVTFSDVTLTDLQVVIENEGISLATHIDEGTINAQSGQLGHLENWLSGEMSVDGEQVALPLPGKEPIFNPDYDRDTHYSAFDCKANFKKVASSEDCDFSQGLGENSARLLVQTLGHIASLVNDSDDGGFEDYSLLLIPEAAEGDAGEMGSLTHATDLCVVGGTPDARVFGTDCEGTDSIVEGNAHVKASRHVTGLRDDIVDLSFLGGLLDIFGAQDALKSITPASHESVTIDVSSAFLTDFGSYTVARGDSEPTGSLVLHTGEIMGTVRPVMQERAGSQGTYDIPTPVAFIEGLEVFNATGTLFGDGKTFNVAIEYAYLDAQNGVFRGEGNTVSGRVKVNGKMVTIEAGTVLNPDFEQEAFDLSYACEEGLSAPVE